MNRHTGILTLTTTAGLLLLASMLPGAHAYGSTAQWQAGFSGTCNVPTMCPGTTGTFGFWGWCAFGGSDGSTSSGTTGTIGDCQFTQYARNDLGQPVNPVHLAVDITGWIIAPNSFGPGFTFHATTGAFTLECTGPSASSPAPFSGCALPPGGDTGVPAAAGHFTISPFSRLPYQHSSHPTTVKPTLVSKERPGKPPFF